MKKREQSEEEEEDKPGVHCYNNTCRSKTKQTKKEKKRADTARKLSGFRLPLQLARTIKKKGEKKNTEEIREKKKNIVGMGWV